MSRATLSTPPTVAPVSGKTPGFDRKTFLSTGSVLAGLGAVACCAAPMILLGMGVTGAWIGGFNALYPYKPYFIAAALILLAAGFVSVYRKPQGTSCENEPVGQNPRLEFFHKTALWVSTLLIIAAFGLPYAAPWFLGAL